jgi:hypothetical protein
MFRTSLNERERKNGFTKSELTPGGSKNWSMACDKRRYICTYVHRYAYVHMQICMYICTYVCTYAHMYVHMHICMYICTYVCTYAHTYAHMYARGVSECIDAKTFSRKTPITKGPERTHLLRATESLLTRVQCYDYCFGPKFARFSAKKIGNFRWKLFKVNIFFCKNGCIFKIITLVPSSPPLSMRSSFSTDFYAKNSIQSNDRELQLQRCKFLQRHG